MAEKKKGKPSKGSSGEEENPDFKFIVRIVNTDIPGDRKIVDGLTSIKGINYRISQILTRKLGKSRRTRMGDLSDDDVDKLKELIEGIPGSLPAWLLNRQRDMDTGEDTHSLGIDLEMIQNEDINQLRKIRSYKGIRHESGHKVRGQRTSSNGRKGSTIGVVRKKK